LSDRYILILILFYFLRNLQNASADWSRAVHVSITIEAPQFPSMSMSMAITLSLVSSKAQESCNRKTHRTKSHSQKSQPAYFYNSCDATVTIAIFTI
jgi:hypothetical protein